MYFKKLQEMKEKLASLGSGLKELDFAYILLQSLPPLYQGIISTINTSADFAQAIITPASVTQLVLDEYNCLQGDKKVDMDEAFTTLFQVQRTRQRRN
jgi:gag-polypeptide of LTR copia-type